MGSGELNGKRDGRLKSKIANEFQDIALEEVLQVYEDKRLVKSIPHSTDRIEMTKTIFNRARDLERETKRVELARAEPDMSQYDLMNKLWKACGYCGAVDITHKGDNGKEYQACFSCRYFLNDDGTTTRMKR